MSQLIFALPGDETPGYLGRVKSALVFRRRLLDENPTPETIDDLVEFLLPYVEEPTDRDEARKGLMNATKSQFDTLLKGITGNAEENPT